MDHDRRLQYVADLTTSAERLDSLAETAELMGDDDGADRFRAEARSRRLVAMSLLDDPSGRA